MRLSTSPSVKRSEASVDVQKVFSKSKSFWAWVGVFMFVALLAVLYVVYAENEAEKVVPGIVPEGGNNEVHTTQ